MMKQKIKYLVIFIALGILVFFAKGIYFALEAKNQENRSLTDIPTFSFKDLQANDYTNKNLPNDKSVVFIFFKSDCPYCQAEISKIAQNLDKFASAQLIFVSTEDLIDILQFAEHYQLNDKYNIIFLRDEDNTFVKRFAAKSIPYVLIYNSQQKLVKRFKGLAKIDLITDEISTNFANISLGNCLNDFLKKSPIEKWIKNIINHLSLLKS